MHQQLESFEAHKDLLCIPIERIGLNNNYCECGDRGGEKRDRESEIDRVEEEKEGRKRKGER